MTKQERILGLGACLALAALSTGCSRLSLGWALAPHLLRHEAGRWLDVQGAEKKELAGDVDAYLKVLALRVAPQAAAWSRHLSKLVAQGQDRAAVDYLFDEGMRVFRAIEEPGVDPAAAWLARDPPRRAAALSREFAEEARREAGLSKGRKADWDRADRLRKGLVDWVGDLDEAQEAQCDAFAQRADYPSEALSEERRRREKALLSALASGASGGELRRQLAAWWLSPEKNRDPELAKAVDAYRQSLRTTLVGLLGTLSPLQREHLVLRLNALAQDLDAIYRKAVLND